MKKWALARGGVAVEEWHLAVPKAVVDINTRYSPMLGVTPSEILLGFNPVTGRTDEEVTCPEFSDAQIEAFEDDDDDGQVIWGAATLAHMDHHETREALVMRCTKSDRLMLCN